MAGTARRGGASRTSYKKENYGRTQAYVDGTAVRKLDVVPEKVQKSSAQAVDAEREKARASAWQLSVGYVLFLTAAAVVTVFTCVNYLQLQAKGTRLQKQVTALEAQLDAAVLENDSKYNQIMLSVDMEHIKQVAMNEYGMSYATGSQIIEYNLPDSDYVRQYSEVPKE